MSNHRASERRVCRVLNFSRRVKRYKRKFIEINERLRQAILRLVKEFPRYGYRKITALLRKEGWQVNRKRVYRLWREEGLKVPQRRKVRRSKGHSSSSIAVLPSEHIDHVWSWDFVSSSTERGVELRWLVVIDEYTRENLYLEPRQSWKAEDVVDSLLELMSSRAIPLCVRSDNGSEFIAHSVRQSFERLGIEMLYIEPGCPWQNGGCESFNAIFRDECLNENSFATLANARRVTKEYQEKYNAIRPHGSLRDLTPREYGEELSTTAHYALS